MGSDKMIVPIVTNEANVIASNRSERAKRRPVRSRKAANSRLNAGPVARLDESPFSIGFLRRGKLTKVRGDFDAS